MARVGVVLEQLLSPVPGGTGRYSAALATSLAATAPEGATVTGWVAAHRDASAARLEAVGGPRRLPVGRRTLAALWERGRGPSPWDCDLVHAPTVLLPPRRRRRRLVVTIHDAVPWTHPETLTRRGVAFHRRMAARAARDADLVVVPTRAARDELEAAVPALSGRCEVVYQGLSGRLEVPGDAPARRSRLRLPDDGFLLSVATLEPRKGLDVLMQALALGAAPDLPLLVAGQPGWGGIDLTALAARHGLAVDRVRALGRVEDADLAVLYEAATALVVPSRSEGFGIPVLEAMAAGTPVVVSDVPALVEVGADAVLATAVGVPEMLASALDAVATDEALRDRLAAAGPRRARAFSWPESARRLWQLYAALG